VAGGDRSGADLALIAALASGQTVQDAAARANVSERTARRRLDNPDFRRRVADARAALLDRAISRLADATAEAADTLRSLLKAESESVRHAAAKTLIDSASKGIELLDLAERVAALERAGEQLAGTESGR
jgi:hypothetical protein